MKNLFKDEKAYTMEIAEEFDSIHYFISFKDKSEVMHKFEVSQDFYNEFQKLQRKVRNLERSDERNAINGGLMDDAIIFESRPLEDIITLKDAVASLTSTQRRRFLLYHEYGLDFVQIATLEGCTKRAVKFTVDIAIKKIKKFFEVDYTLGF